MKRYETLRVCPDFKTAIKIKAAEEGMTIFGWTEQVIRNNENPLEELAHKLKKQSERRHGYDFP